MKRHKFTTIKEVLQAQTLVKAGTLVAERKKGFYKIQLYQLRFFYLEVYRHTHFNVIIKVTRFTELKYVEPYLPSINIKCLFDN